MTIAREVLETAHEDGTITVCTVPDNKAAALARAVLNVARLARAEEYRANRETIEGSWGGSSMRLGFVEDLRAALNGDDQ